MSSTEPKKPSAQSRKNARSVPPTSSVQLKYSKPDVWINDWAFPTEPWRTLVDVHRRPSLAEPPCAPTEKQDLRLAESENRDLSLTKVREKKQADPPLEGPLVTEFDEWLANRRQTLFSSPGEGTEVTTSQYQSELHTQTNTTVGESTSYKSIGRAQAAGAESEAIIKTMLETTLEKLQGITNAMDAMMEIQKTMLQRVTFDRNAKTTFETTMSLTLETKLEAFSSRISELVERVAETSVESPFQNVVEVKEDMLVQRIDKKLDKMIVKADLEDIKKTILFQKTTVEKVESNQKTIMKDIKRLKDIKQWLSDVELHKKVHAIERNKNVEVDLRTGDVNILSPIEFEQYSIRQHGDRPPPAQFKDVPVANKIVSDLAALIKMFPVQTSIEGHTLPPVAGKSPSGKSQDPETAKKVALSRAECMKEALVDAGVAEELLSIVPPSGASGKSFSADQKPSVTIQMDLFPDLG